MADPVAPCPVPGPLGPLLGAIGRPFYALGIRLQNWRFDRRIGVRRVAVPVISVGNLSTGGTGKSPMVLWLARRLEQVSVPAVIALRGYRGGPGGVESDEVRQYRRELPGATLIVGGDRAAGIGRFLDSPEGATARAVLLDDGFQHRQLARDLDIVLVDATRDPFDDRLLPLGRLREPVASLRRASLVVLTRFREADPAHRQLRDRLRDLAGHAPFTAGARWLGLRGVPQQHSAPVSWLDGRRLVVVCGIGNPAAFLRQVKESVAGETLRSLFFPDHFSYRRRNIDEIAIAARQLGADAIVTTEKDWSKLADFPTEVWPCPVVRPRLELDLGDDGDRLLARVHAVLRAPGPHASVPSEAAGGVP